MCPATRRPRTPRTAAPRVNWWGPAFTPAGSSTWTTAEDMMRFAQAVLDGSAPGVKALDPVLPIPRGRDRARPGTSARWRAGRSPGTTAPPAAIGPILGLDRERGQAVLILGNSTRAPTPPVCGSRPPPRAPTCSRSDRLDAGPRPRSSGRCSAWAWSSASPTAGSAAGDRLALATAVLDRAARSAAAAVPRTVGPGARPGSGAH